jgi:uncharacterized protein
MISLDFDQELGFDESMTLDEIKIVASKACKQFDISRMYVFGSHARGCSTPSSDIDFLVEFNNPNFRPAKRYFGLLHELEDSFHCKVDLLTLSGLKNPYLRRRILDEKVTIYEG